MFGSKCCRCGLDDWRILELDHINGGGTADRMAGRIDQAYTRKMIEWARANQHVFQLLCANCHRIKTWEDRERGRLGLVQPSPVPLGERRKRRSLHGKIAADRRWAGRSAEERSEMARRSAGARQAKRQAGVPDGSKRCYRCKEVVSLDAYGANAWCRSCCAAYKRERAGQH